jgi:hypothetical protein
MRLFKPSSPHAAPPYWPASSRCAGTFALSLSRGPQPISHCTAIEIYAYLRNNDRCTSLSQMFSIDIATTSHASGLSCAFTTPATENSESLQQPKRGGYYSNPPEGCISNISGTWQSKEQLKIRHADLPDILPYMALNAIDPLGPYAPKYTQGDTLEEMRERRLQAARTRSTWCVRSQKDYQNGRSDPVGYKVNIGR